MKFNIPLFVAALVSGGSAATASFAAGDAAHGQALSEVCSSCHGAAGQTPIEGYPMLAGQKAKYLVKQLREMRQSAKDRAGVLTESKTGVARITRAQRSNETMDPFVVDLSNQDIDDLGAYYASLKCTAIMAAPPLPAPKVEARCRICHGETGIGKQSTMPNLAGQDVVYLETQLLNLRAAATEKTTGENKRRAAIMETQARHLTDADIKAIAEYYARLPCNG